MVCKHKAQVLAMCDGVDITKLSYIIVVMTVGMFMKSDFSDCDRTHLCSPFQQFLSIFAWVPEASIQEYI